MPPKGVPPNTGKSQPRSPKSILETATPTYHPNTENTIPRRRSPRLLKQEDPSNKPLQEPTEPSTYPVNPDDRQIHPASVPDYRSRPRNRKRKTPELESPKEPITRRRLARTGPGYNGSHLATPEWDQYRKREVSFHLRSG
jgi:hypothetical protein